MKTGPRPLVKKLFEAFGLEIHRKQSRPPEKQDATNPPRVSMTGALRQIASLGFKPQTIIDVGVGSGTAELYQQFTDANILLIEPLAEFEPSLKKLCREHRAQYVLAAAGETSGTVGFNFHVDQPDCSSLLKEVEGPSVDGVLRQVPMVTVDQICAEKGLTGPYLLKADVQGAELQVLAGAAHTLKETELVILEGTLFGTMIGGPQVFDLLSRMKELEFVLYDAWGFLYRPFDNALSQLDMAFVREGGRFRQSHVFATPEQRERMALPLPGEATRAERG